MRRAFTKDDFLNVREAKKGDSLEFGCGAVNANMGGEVDPVYGAWEHSKKVPVLLKDGMAIHFEGITMPYDDPVVVRVKDGQLYLEVPLISFTFKDLGREIKVAGD
jgi:hypothetical protein